MLNFVEFVSSIKCVSNIFSSLSSMNRTLLYAPTWRDADQATTFFDEIETLICDLTPDWNLIVKIHPLLPQRDPSFYYRIAALDDKRPNLIVVEKFPALYPILERVDAYLGDYSSIGYDALAFQIPLFFLRREHLPDARLHHCGQIINPKEGIFASIERGLLRSTEYISKQIGLYKKAFDAQANLADAIKVISNPIPQAGERKRL